MFDRIVRALLRPHLEDLEAQVQRCHSAAAEARRAATEARAAASAAIDRNDATLRLLAQARALRAGALAGAGDGGVGDGGWRALDNDIETLD